MAENSLKTVTSVATVPVTVTPESTYSEMNVASSSIVGNGYAIHLAQNANTTAFVGTMNNEVLTKVIRVFDGSREQLLIDAVNNRTRERNYYQLYSRLLENEISEDDFDRMLNENLDDYVITTDKKPTEQEFHDAIALADYIKGIESTGDIETLFSFNGEIFNEYCNKLLNGTL